MRMGFATNILNRVWMKVQHTGLRRDITQPNEGYPGLEGNPYPSYECAVMELGRKYSGIARWGNHAARNVVDTRAAFALGQGIRLSAAPDAANATAELAWCQAFLSHNALDLEELVNWQRESEIEGRLAVVLSPDRTTTNMVNARFLPWTFHGYDVAVSPKDYAMFEKITYQEGRAGAAVTLNTDSFVYRPYGGRTAEVKLPVPKACGVLRNMEAADKALSDLREINHLFASPTPHFKCADGREAAALDAMLAKSDWRIGRYLVTSAEFTMVGPDGAGVDALIKEITINAQIIAGHTGVPVHFLGFPELMSNRNTADTLAEALSAAVSKERKVTQGFMQELLEKAIAMANGFGMTPMNPKAVKVDIAEADAAALAELNTVWIPLYEAGAISLETLLKMVPGIDATEETKRVNSESARKAADTLARIKATPAAAGIGGSLS